MFCTVDMALHTTVNPKLSGYICEIWQYFSIKHWNIHISLCNSQPLSDHSVWGWHQMFCSKHLCWQILIILPQKRLPCHHTYTSQQSSAWDECLQLELCEPSWPITIPQSGTSNDSVLTNDEIWCGLRIRINRSPIMWWVTMMVRLSLQQKCC